MLSSMVSSYISYINYIGIIIKIPGNTDLHLNLSTLRGRLEKIVFDITVNHNEKLQESAQLKTQKHKVACTVVTR